MITVDQLWVLVSAGLVFFMQAGFLALETGLVRPQNVGVTAMKVLVDWMLTSVIWVAFGYALAFGDTAGGLFGTSMFFGDGIEGTGWITFLFQLGFVGASTAIVSGAMAERVAFHTYVVCTIINAGIIYPLVAHWVWGKGVFAGQAAFLYDLGFRDFAGATVVHSVGGWISLVGIWVLGPRLGRFDADGNPRPIESYNIALAALGVFILWFGWWGFNGGSTPALDGGGVGNSTALVIANTNLGGATAGLVAWLHGRFLPPHRDVQNKFMGGALAGLVAITACSNIVSPTSALLIGALAGLAHNVVYELLLRLRLDDPVGAVPVHLGGGILGTLCVAGFGKSEWLPEGRFTQLAVQGLGVIVVGALCVLVTFGVLAVLKRTIGLRVSPHDEKRGISLEVPEAAPDLAAGAVDADELRRRMMGEEE